ncbi:RIP metalloprotease RseP [Pseudaestuariivita atlantica]|uniref:Zinc metalloprotease n=1 Tax=Pseudaestuariivita atlantica TaxID=1317121 RepID=A0A0L1JMN6_9RHOB|nr:RIP metalloprotease RseP [Pseudaestuariivita atlantica]KNG93014.1 zinc metalloprotease [Pseudaestuariivita atlantica]
MDPIALIPQFSSFFWIILAFVVALSVIVAVHEYGHYIVGRWSGIKADVFSLGFGPVLYSRTDRHGTKWQFAALPFGGYVKFAGDANAASGKDEEAMAGLSAEEARHTMHGAPLWARAATVLAGPVFNFALSILVFAGVIAFNGVVEEPLTVGELRPTPVETTLAPGDIIREIQGIPMPGPDATETGSDYYALLPVTPVTSYTVTRDGQTVEATGPNPLPPIVLQLSPQSAALAAGLKAGDVITAIEGTPVYAFSELKEAVESSNGAPLNLTVWREGSTFETTLTPRRVDEPQADNTFVTQWRIGIAGGLFFEPQTSFPGVGTALSNGVEQTWRIITGSISGLGHMITGAISSCNLSGPIGIAQTSGAMASQGAESFIWFIAVLSTAVGLLNLFPIPMLDGGHLTFYAYEAVTGRPPNDRAMRLLMSIGLTLILSLMTFALFNDIFCP